MIDETLHSPGDSDEEGPPGTNITDWEWQEYHHDIREIVKVSPLSDDQLHSNLEASEAALVGAANLGTSAFPNRCFETDEAIPQGEFNGFPRVTFMEAWNKDDPQNNNTHKRKDAAYNAREEDFLNFMKSDSIVGGYQEVDGKPSNVWIKDPLMDTNLIVEPVKDCFLRAQYGELLVRSLLEWRCFPPMYPRHTIHEQWFEQIDRLDNEVWTPQEGGIYAYEVIEANQRISKSIELRKVFEAFETMVRTIEVRVSRHENSLAGKLMDIVDEIYLTEQLCNVLYGTRYLLDKEALAAGEWISWDYLNTLWNSVSFTPRSDTYWHELTGKVRTHILYPNLVARVSAKIKVMMDFCIGIDFRLPYMRITELRDKYRTRQEMWPTLLATELRLTPRPFPKKIKASSPNESHDDLVAKVFGVVEELDALIDLVEESEDPEVKAASKAAQELVERVTTEVVHRVSTYNQVLQLLRDTEAARDRLQMLVKNKGDSTMEEETIVEDAGAGKAIQPPPPTVEDDDDPFSDVQMDDAPVRPLRRLRKGPAAASAAEPSPSPSPSPSISDSEELEEELEELGLSPLHAASLD